MLDTTSPTRAVAPSAVLAEPILSVQRLSKSFAKGPTVLAGIDIDIQPGEAVALIGANGTGKSTFVRCLLRLIEPNDGCIRMFGLDVRSLNARSLRRFRSRVGFVFQRHNLVLRLSALSNVVHGVQGRMSGPRSWCHPLAPREVRHEAMLCLERVGLDGKAAARADTLSGGQSQRVAIARMLMQRPEFVIADEPIASLDPKAGLEIMRLLHETTRERGLGLLFISHDLDLAIEYSDRIIGLSDGRVALDVPSDEADPRILRQFFDEPRS